MEEISGLYYRPRTKESRETYELLLTFIQKSIGDQVIEYYIMYIISMSTCFIVLLLYHPLIVAVHVPNCIALPTHLFCIIYTIISYYY